MCHIEHIALWTRDIDRLAAFYCEYLGALVGELYVNSSRGFSSRFLRFAQNARLELMCCTPVVLERDTAGAQRVGLTHLAFCVGTEVDVDTLTQRLSDDGYRILSAPRRTGDGYYESVVCDPDGNSVELCAT